jgi:CheY-like chemotaxis protein
LQVLKAIRTDERTKRIPVVILTSSREQRDLTEGHNLGVNAYIQKPVDFNQFTDTIRQIGMFWLLLNQAPPEVTYLASKSKGV